MSEKPFLRFSRRLSTLGRYKPNIIISKKMIKHIVRDGSQAIDKFDRLNSAVMPSVEAIGIISTMIAMTQVNPNIVFLSGLYIMWRKSRNDHNFVNELNQNEKLSLDKTVDLCSYINNIKKQNISGRKKKYRQNLKKEKIEDLENFHADCLDIIRDHGFDPKDIHLKVNSDVSNNAKDSRVLASALSQTVIFKSGFLNRKKSRARGVDLIAHELAHIKYEHSSQVLKANQYIYLLDKLSLANLILAICFRDVNLAIISLTIPAVARVAKKIVERNHEHLAVLHAYSMTHIINVDTSNYDDTKKDPNIASRIKNKWLGKIFRPYPSLNEAHQRARLLVAAHLNHNDIREYLSNKSAPGFKVPLITAEGGVWVPYNAGTNLYLIEMSNHPYAQRRAKPPVPPQ